MKEDETIKRQLLTLEVSLKENVQYSNNDYFNDIILVQNSLTNISVEDVDLSIEFLGHKLDFPLTIAPLTGGADEVLKINEGLAKFAHSKKIAMGIGNQIVGIDSEKQGESFKIVRKTNPDGFIFANLDAHDLITSIDPVNLVKNAIKMIEANAIHIIFDPLRDLLIYPEKTSYNGFQDILKTIVDSIEIPIVVRSYSTGFCNEDVKQFWDLGISAIDIEGVGGTSYARTDTLKTMSLADKQSAITVVRPFDFWGTPTLWSLLDIALRPENKNLPLIIGGGFRNGIQIVKALALGADCISVGFPILVEILEDFGYPDENNLDAWFNRIILEIKMTMCLLGAKNIPELREIVRNRFLILGKTKEWLDGRHIQYPPKQVKK